MRVSIAGMLLAVAVIMLVQIAWRLITKRDDIDGLKKIASNTSSALFWGLVIILALLALFSFK
jgi:hypothetical protein